MLTTMFRNDQIGRNRLQELMFFFFVQKLEENSSKEVAFMALRGGLFLFISDLWAAIKRVRVDNFFSSPFF